ncbi:hypothetical protein FQZ97_953560 [compost metagenome]
MGTREENLRTTLFATHVVNIGADAITITECFTRDQFVTTNDCFAAAEIDNHIAIFDALDSAVGDFANAILEFVILTITLGFANLLHDDLLG